MTPAEIVTDGPSAATATAGAEKTWGREEHSSKSLTSDAQQREAMLKAMLKDREKQLMIFYCGLKEILIRSHLNLGLAPVWWRFLHVSDH